MKRPETIISDRHIHAHKPRYVWHCPELVGIQSHQTSSIWISRSAIAIRSENDCFSHSRKQTRPSQFRDIQAFNRRGSRRKEIEGGQWKRIVKHDLAFPELKALNH
jgi:hypothetical protein